mgnify:FL=1
MTIIFATETTGTPKNYKAPPADTDNWPRMVQLAWVLINDDGKLIRGFTFNIQPDGWTVEPGAEAVHGLSLERLQETGHPAPKIIQKFFDDYDTADTLVAHNMNFDFNILAAEAIRYRLQAKTRIARKVCTMEASTDLLKLRGGFRGGYKWPKLSELHEYLFQQGFDGAHDALVDVQACARCFFELKKRGVL